MTITLDLKSNKDEVKNFTNAQIIRGLEAIGFKSEDYASRLCPVDTGRLRSSITHEVAEDEQAVYLGTNVYYAPYVEMGTRRYPYPRPFIKPAMEDHLDEYQQMFVAIGGL